jgi:hypothetical protein
MSDGIGIWSCHVVTKANYNLCYGHMTKSVELNFFTVAPCILVLYSLIYPTDTQLDCSKRILKFTLTFWNRSFTFKF